jgi:hypothetical protein
LINTKQSIVHLTIHVDEKPSHHFRPYLISLCRQPPHARTHTEHTQTQPQPPVLKCPCTIHPPPVHTHAGHSYNAHTHNPPTPNTALGDPRAAKSGKAKELSKNDFLAMLKSSTTKSGTPSSTAAVSSRPLASSLATQAERSWAALDDDYMMNAPKLNDYEDDEEEEGEGGLEGMGTISEGEESDDPFGDDGDEGGGAGEEKRKRRRPPAFAGKGKGKGAGPKGKKRGKSRK